MYGLVPDNTVHLSHIPADHGDYRYTWGGQGVGGGGGTGSRGTTPHNGVH